MQRSLLVFALAFLALGCDDVRDQNQFIVRVTSINGPVFADTCKLETNPDGTKFCTIPSDVVIARFENKPSSSSIITDPSNFGLDFHIKSYAVKWRRADGGPTSGIGWTLSDFDFIAGTSTVVPINGFADLAILISSASMKTRVPFSAGAEIQLIGDIDFTGSSAIDPDDEIHVLASVSVSVADWADD